MRSPLLLLLLAVACQGKDDVVVTDDSEPGVIRESSLIDDSGDTSADDSAVDDTGEAPVEMVSLTISPPRLLVDIGAHYTLRGTFLGSDGKAYAAAPTYASSDEAVATVDASGVVTAVGAGEVSLSAEAEGLTASATLVVQEVSDLYVRVVDANSGEPIPNARVTWLGREAVTDANGEGSVGVTAGTPITLTAFLPESDYIPASVINVIARDIVVPLRPSSEEAEAPAGLSGGVDYAGVVEAEWDEQVVGLVGPSLQRSPLLFDPGQLLAPDREVTLYGVPVELPGNLYLQGQLDTWEARAWEGEVELWTLAGPVPVSELTAGFASSGEALAVLLSHLSDFRYDALTGLTASAEGLTGLEVAPASPLEDSLHVTVPELPEGATGNEQALLVALEDGADAGWRLVGLGIAGPGEADISVLPGDGDRMVLAYYELSGVGSGQGHAVATSPVAGTLALPDPWMSPPTLDSLNGETRAIEVTSDARATAVRVYINAPADGGHRDVWMPSGVVSGVVPENGPRVGLGRPNVEVLAVETWGGTWEALLTNGGLAESQLVEGARTSAGWSGRVSAE